MNTFYKNMLALVTTEKLFVGLSFLVNLFFLLYFFGFLKSKNKWFDAITFYLKLFIAFFLVLKFHPFSQVSTFTALDRKVAFSAGVYLLTIYGIEFYQKTVSLVQQIEQKVFSSSSSSFPPDSMNNTLPSVAT